jgi:saccharopine dehydrogenase (NAD+, L-lysine-forming)
MGKVLVIGAGGVGTVMVHKMASLPEVFGDIMLASRTKSKCDAIVEKTGNKRIQTAQIDADKVPQLVKLIKSFNPDLVVNVALPYQDLHIMDACLETGVSYLGTAGSGHTRTDTKRPE